MTARDPRSGRFQRVDPARDVLAPDLGVPEKFAYDLERRYAPAGDTLAGAGPTYGSSPPQPRFARVVSGGSERTVYTVPKPETMRGAHTGESGRPVDAEMRYVLGDTDESAPGEVNSWPQMRRLDPVAVHPDDEGNHNRVMRTAARGAGADSPLPFLTGLDSRAAEDTGQTSVTAYGDGTGRTMSPRRAEDIDPRRR